MATTTASPCISCGISDIKTLRLLKCDTHYKCMKCIEKGNSFSCEKCSAVVQSPASTTEKVFVYMDNSNIWIEAKKLLRDGAKEDKRVRVDVGRLLKIVAKEREVGKAILYGSEPPPLDTVWKEMKERGWEVKTQERSLITDKEKQIDTQMVADVTKCVCKSGHDNNVIILISGDADIIPAIEIAMEEKWKVEVYMWKHAMSSKLKNLDVEDIECTIYYLDDCQKDILFNSMKFPIANNKRLLSIVRANGVVCKMKPDAFKRSNGTPTNKWCRAVEAKFQAKFRFFWLEELNTETHKDNLLVLVFTDIAPASFKIADILKTQEPSISIQHVLEIETYLQYEHKHSDHMQSPILLTNSFDCSKLEKGILELIGLPDDICTDSSLSSSTATSTSIEETTDSHNESEIMIDTTSIEEEEGWKTVEYNRKPKNTKQLFSQPCKDGLDCPEGLNCKYKHTDKEKEHFRMRIQPRLKKTRLCRLHPKCTKPASKCDFAHGEDDAVCLKCKAKGHIAEKCKRQ